MTGREIRDELGRRRDRAKEFHADNPFDMGLIAAYGEAIEMLESLTLEPGTCI